ncbi:MAG: hypothetical protein IJJ28_01725 [Lentisphaeria bacterium]|nr:hypothetical protein [Lentisphaeria bacterium]
MIYATYSETFFFYFLLWLLLILFLWRREESRVRRNEWRISRNQLFHCDNCHHSFVNRDRGASICRCPRCNAICIRRRDHEV